MKELAMRNPKQTFYLLSTLIIFTCLIPASAWARKNPFEKKGTFGFEYYGNFVTLNYLITCLGESYKPGHLTFRIDFEDTKGFDLSQQVVESECKLKDVRNNKVPGKVERISDSSIRILFPFDDDFKTDGKMKLYTVIRDYKLYQTFECDRSSITLK